MSFWFVAGALILILLVSLALAVLGKKPERSPYRPEPVDPKKVGIAGVCFSAIALTLVTLIFSITTVDARAVGIQTSFGRYVDTLENGFQITAPWSSVEEFSTLTQTLKLQGEGSEIPVAFAGGSSGYVDLTVRWSTTEEGAEGQWRQYRTFENVRDQLVEPESRNAARTEFSEYTPVQSIDGTVLNSITSDVEEVLRERLAKSGINVVGVQVTNVRLGERAQKALDRIVEANANIERATAEQEKAIIEAKTAEIRQKSQTEEALARYCLEIMNAWNVKENGDLPATFNCLGNSQAGVLVGAK